MVKKKQSRNKRPKAKQAQSSSIFKHELVKWGLIPLLLALASWWSGLDNALATLVYAPESSVAWWFRQNGTLPGYVLGVGGLVIVILMGIGALGQEKYKTVHHAALASLLTIVFGVGLLAQVLVQDAVDRPRPRDSVLQQEQTQTELSGHSFPSGHAAIGFALAAPAFVFAGGSKARGTFLLIGLVWGALLGVSRMVLGAHFLSDVLAAAAFTLGSAVLFAPLAGKIKRIPFWVTIAFVAVSFLALVLGNKFTLHLALPKDQTWSRLNLPCSTQVATPQNLAQGQGDMLTKPHLSVMLTGYGAPLSTLRLNVDKAGVVTLQTRQGLYRKLACTATITLPAQ